jgi:hypothetical protein
MMMIMKMIMKMMMMRMVVVVVVVMFITTCQFRGALVRQCARSTRLPGADWRFRLPWMCVFVRLTVKVCAKVTVKGETKWILALCVGSAGSAVVVEDIFEEEQTHEFACRSCL